MHANFHSIILVDGLNGAEQGLVDWARPLHRQLVLQSMNSAIHHLDLKIRLKRVTDLPESIKEAQESVLAELYASIKVSFRPPHIRHLLTSVKE